MDYGINLLFVLNRVTILFPIVLLGLLITLLGIIVGYFDGIIYQNDTVKYACIGNPSRLRENTFRIVNICE